MSDRKKLFERIRAIMAKTMANGCTEAEAMAALNKAQEMMASYEVTEADLAGGGEEMATVATGKADPYTIKRGLSMAVGGFTGCRVWGSPSNGVTFAGHETDAAFAEWLVNMLADFVRRELKAYLKIHPANGRRLVSNGFVHGCVVRINERLNELTAQQRAASAGNGRALVINRMALVNAYVATLGLRLRNSTSRGRRVDGKALAAGRNAGNGASFNRPVNGGAGVRMIGSRA